MLADRNMGYGSQASSTGHIACLIHGPRGSEQQPALRDISTNDPEDVVEDPDHSIRKACLQVPRRTAWIIVMSITTQIQL